jgi:outer membrane receptor protein involved in Fe transport
MRGLSTGGTASQASGSTSNFSNVATYLDEQSGQLPSRNLDIYAVDLERIEELEGPQGTLFGAGAEPGVLRYITNKPKIDASPRTSSMPATLIRPTVIRARTSMRPSIYR